MKSHDICKDCSTKITIGGICGCNSCTTCGSLAKKEVMSCNPYKTGWCCEWCSKLLCIEYQREAFGLKRYDC